MITRKKCRYCGKVFETDRPRKLFCNDECSHKWYLQSMENKKSHEKVCGYCGKIFTTKIGHARYCSPACGRRGAAKAKRERECLKMTTGKYEYRRELVAMNRKAKECGLSYGQYVAQQERGARY